MKTLRIKKKATLLSVGSNSFLILLKLIVGFLSGSVSIISEAIHSLTDLLASFLAYYSVKASSEPADIEHQFGHGKFEDLSGGIEGLLIIIAAAYIIYEAVENMFNGVTEYINTTIGIVVMIISIIINVFVSTYLFKVAHKTESFAVLADAQHLRADIFTSIGVLIGLILIKLTGNTFFDPLIAIIIALMIIKTGIDLCRTSVNNLLDSSLPEDERIVIRNIVSKFIPNEALEIIKLKTRKAGTERIIEITLSVFKDMTVKESHDLCNKIEENLKIDLKNCIITIHIEPCDENCSKCNFFIVNKYTCKNQDR